MFNSKQIKKGKIPYVAGRIHHKLSGSKLRRVTMALDEAARKGNTALQVVQNLMSWLSHDEMGDVIKALQEVYESGACDEDNENLGVTSPESARGAMDAYLARFPDANRLKR